MSVSWASLLEDASQTANAQNGAKNILILGEDNSLIPPGSTPLLLLPRSWPPYVSPQPRGNERYINADIWAAHGSGST